MLRQVAVVLSLVVLPSLPAAAQTRVDFDRHADFRQYRTFQVIVGPLVRTDGAVDEQNTLAEDRIRRAVTTELMARGLEPTDGRADLLVRVSGRNTERSEIVSSGLNSYPVYYRRWGYYRSYGYWGRRYYNDYWTRRYLEGSLIVDAVDRDTDKLVYRAQVSEEVGKDLDKHVTKAIDQAFKKFPLKEREN
jgi:hypothetical protein